MSGVTVVFDIAEALYAAFHENATLSDIDTITGPGAGAGDPDEWISIGYARADRSPKTMTGQRLGGCDENGSVPILVKASASGAGEETVQTARARLEELVGAVEAALAVDFTLGGLVKWAYVSAVAEYDQDIRPKPNAGRWITAEVTVTFSARIYPGSAT